ncbi:MAG: small GTP-binding protein [Acidobacteria bacterium]|nr:small GTP-binding protein [Acidobacteriota bacterium]
MPANLTPEYKRAEERFRAAKGPEEKLEALEEMLRVVPKHKGTDGLQADLKSRIAKLKKQPATKAGKSSFTHMIPREGAGQVALVGPPNSGKSSLVAALTRATPEVGEYAFTTRDATPGMMRFENIWIQLVDLPPVSAQHAEPWVFDLVRTADLCWLVVDGRWAIEGLEETLALLGERGIGLRPAGEALAVRGLERVVRPALLIVTGLDRADVASSLDAIEELLERRWPITAVSAPTGAGLDALPRRTFDALGVIRVRTKPPGQPLDESETPFTLPRGGTVEDLAARIHKDLLSAMKFARVWGSGAFDGQTVHRDHVLADGDIVEIHE